MKDKLLEALYKIRRLAVSTLEPDVIIRKIIVIAVDICDEVEGRQTSLEEKKTDDE